MKKINFKLIVVFTIVLIINISSCRMAIQSLLAKKNEQNSEPVHYNMPDTQKATYCTGRIITKKNSITLQKNNGDKEISVAMQNPPTNFNPALFKWELIQNEGEICSIDFNGEKFVITPLSAGTTIIKISHPAALYSSEILVRVVENVYIKPSKTFVEISRDD